MKKTTIEIQLKRFLKRKVKITLGLLVTFMINGTIAFSADETKDGWSITSNEKWEGDNLSVNGTGIIMNAAGGTAIEGIINAKNLNITSSSSGIDVSDKNETLNINVDDKIQVSSGQDSDGIKVNSGNVNIKSKDVEVLGGKHGIFSNNGTAKVEGKNINIIAEQDKAIETNNDGEIIIGNDSATDDVNITGKKVGILSWRGEGANAGEGGKVTIKGNNVVIKAEGDENSGNGHEGDFNPALANGIGIWANRGSIDIISDKLTIEAGLNEKPGTGSIKGEGIEVGYGNVNITSNEVDIKAKGNGIHSWAEGTDEASTEIKSNGEENSYFKIDAGENGVMVHALTKVNIGISENEKEIFDKVEIKAEGYGITGASGAEINIAAKDTINITGKKTGIHFWEKGTITLKSDNAVNIIADGEEKGKDPNDPYDTQREKYIANGIAIGKADNSNLPQIKKLDISSKNVNIEGMNDGIHLWNQAEVDITENISKTTINGKHGDGIDINNSIVKIKSNEITVLGGDHGIYSRAGGEINIEGDTLYVEGGKNHALSDTVRNQIGIAAAKDSKITIKAKKANIIGYGNAMHFQNGGIINLTADDVYINGENRSGIKSGGVQQDDGTYKGGTATITSNTSLIYGKENAVEANAAGTINLNSKLIEIESDEFSGIYSWNGTVNVGGTDKNDKADSVIIKAGEGGTFPGTTTKANIGIHAAGNISDAKVTINSKKTSITSDTHRGIHVGAKGEIEINSTERIAIKAGEIGVYGDSEGKVNINSKKTLVEGGQNGMHVWGANINVGGENNNSSELVYVSGTNNGIASGGEKGLINIDSKIFIAESKDIGINAFSSGTININNSESILINSKGTGVSVSKNGIININDNRYTHISSDREGMNVADGGKAEVNTQEFSITAGGNGLYSDNGEILISSKETKISGEKNGIFSGGNGKVTVTGNESSTIIGKDFSLKADAGGKINLTGDKNHRILGNVLSEKQDSLISIGGKRNFISSIDENSILKVEAKNNGSIDMSLQDGLLIGNVSDNRHPSSQTVQGKISLDLDNGKWDMQGTSYVTDITLKNDGNIRFMENTTALDIENLSGNGNGKFVMEVNSIDKSQGNMLYVHKSEGGKYSVDLSKSDLSDIEIGEKVRFATIGQDAKSNNLEFNVLPVKEQGILNVEFDVEYEDFTKDDSENSTYNNGDKKPGDEYVKDNFQGGENWYLTRNDKGGTSDIGDTILETAKSNYAYAVYMDNLNKRLGDMSFVNGMDGLWVRLRNDRVGEDNQYRLHNYMTQIGYDKEYTMDNGLEYRGIAFEYGKGDMKYKELDAKADMERYLVTLYDTRVRDNGVYTDYLLRGGILTTDFNVKGRETGVTVNTDYNNLLLGANVEIGKRYDLDDEKNSYFEPQLQAQYTYVNSADYKTNQGTKVDLGEIHSLIGRAGFRLGYDMYKENSKDNTLFKDNTIYIKADINHEFLGDQDITAKDKTGKINKTYHNDETWYDIGIGAAKKITPDFNVYMDIEKQFGSSKDNNSWQFNLGFRYRFGEKVERTVPKLTPTTMRIISLSADSYFDFDKSVLKPEGKESIKKATQVINEKNLKGTLLIEGHTDSMGSEEYNQRLSERRAEAVKDEFKKNIIGEDIYYKTKGYGETRPVTDNKTKEGRAKNRRVDIKFEGKLEEITDKTKNNK